MAAAIESQTVKAQAVRVLDVVLVGPAVIYAGYLLRDRHEGLASLLYLIGASTVVYNARNFRRVMDAAGMSP